MKLIGKKILDDFKSDHADVRTWINNWVSDVESAKWDNTQDIKNKYSSASFLANCVVIFNVKGNSYRLETIIAYAVKVVTVVWIGTHAEYDKRIKKDK